MHYIRYLLYTNILQGNAVFSIHYYYTWLIYAYDFFLSYRRISVSQYVTEIGDVISHFNITKVQVEDGGLYECIVSNRAGQVSHSAKIQVYGLYA